MTSCCNWSVCWHTTVEAASASLIICLRDAKLPFHIIFRSWAFIVSQSASLLWKTSVSCELDFLAVSSKNSRFLKNVLLWVIRQISRYISDQLTEIICIVVSESNLTSSFTVINISEFSVAEISNQDISELIQFCRTSSLLYVDLQVISHSAITCSLSITINTRCFWKLWFCNTVLNDSEIAILRLRNTIYYQHREIIDWGMRNTNHVSNSLSEYQLIILMYLNLHSTLQMNILHDL